MKRLFSNLVIAGAMMFGTTHSQGEQHNDAPWQALNLVGQGKLSVLFWDIYNARLYTASGNYQPQTYPIALQLTYLRDFTQKQLVTETEKQWQKLGYTDKQKINAWLATLEKLWPDVSENQSITLYINAEQQSFFYFNHERLGQLDDPEFAQAFLAIWLSEETSAPEVRKKLIASR